ncbi:hypothetical protein HUT06_01405 [Actinomadura sp. NAK00032]|uniref:hypothetical protein n=1 Tax=Actinomadura sp. NAK00032 TaxID=2742128 RepID=UPI0015908DE7|nr:hypothetical protein [Actinomadura sp. NAK00032]QKW32857.1 hypothetical protein HUT06_01405 [Actinomadura sp. NAK00032]
MERVEIRPRPWLLGMVLAGALGFSAFGLAAVVYGDSGAIAFGLVTVIFFGGGTTSAMLIMARRRFVSLTLTPLGIEVNGGLIPWEDVQAVGVMKASTELLGIRLARYDRYVASMMPADRIVAEERMRWFLRPIAAIDGLFPGAGLGNIARTASSLERGLRLGRNRFGWEFVFSPVMIDRPLVSFVAFVEDYRRSSPPARDS